MGAVRMMRGAKRRLGIQFEQSAEQPITKVNTTPRTWAKSSNSNNG